MTATVGLLFLVFFCLLAIGVPVLASIGLGICRFVSVLFMLWEQTGELKDLNLAAIILKFYKPNVAL